MSTENKTLEAEALAWMESDEFKACPRIFLVKAAYIAGAKRGFEEGFEMATEGLSYEYCNHEGKEEGADFESDSHFFTRKYATYEDALAAWEGKK